MGLGGGGEGGEGFVGGRDICSVVSGRPGAGGREDGGQGGGRGRAEFEYEVVGCGGGVGAARGTSSPAECRVASGRRPSCPPRAPTEPATGLSRRPPAIEAAAGGEDFGID